MIFSPVQKHYKIYPHPNDHSRVNGVRLILGVCLSRVAWMRFLLHPLYSQGLCFCVCACVPPFYIFFYYNFSLTIQTLQISRIFWISLPPPPHPTPHVKYISEREAEWNYETFYFWNVPCSHMYKHHGIPRAMQIPSFS